MDIINGYNKIYFYFCILDIIKNVINNKANKSR